MLEPSTIQLDRRMLATLNTGAPTASYEYPFGTVCVAPCTLYALSLTVLFIYSTITVAAYYICDLRL